MSFQFEKVWPYMDLLWAGLTITLKVTILSFLFGFVIAIFLVLFRLSKFKLLDRIVSYYVLIVRSMPELLQLFIVFFAVPQLTMNLIRFDAQTAAIIVFSLNAGVYISEVLRGGILGMDKGQTEASLALGVPNNLTMIYIVFPQVFKKVLPSLVNEAITVFKVSALMSQIGVMDLFLSSMTVVKSTYITFEPYVLVALFYYVVVCILTYCAQLLERRLSIND